MFTQSHAARWARLATRDWSHVYLRKLFSRAFHSPTQGTGKGRQYWVPESHQTRTRSPRVGDPWSIVQENCIPARDQRKYRQLSHCLDPAQIQSSYAIASDRAGRANGTYTLTTGNC